MSEKPLYTTEEHLEFLDNLMQNGQMSSFSAAQMMMHKFPTLSYEQTNTIITYWIYSYEERRHP